MQVELKYKPIKRNGKLTLLEVDLITGKSHQIRAQLSEAGFPIIGDPKYGNNKINNYFKKKYNLSNQLLHAANYILYNDNKELLNASAEVPIQFKKILEGEFNN